MSSAHRQRILIEDFRQITNTNSEISIRFLKNNKWNFDDALDDYFTNPPIAVNKTSLMKIWNNYKDEDDENLMNVPDGLIEYGKDLNIDLTSDLALCLAQLCGATLQATHWPKDQWLSGWTSAGADSIEKQKDFIGTCRNKLIDDSNFFSKVYNHTFELGKSQGSRILEFDDAKAYWSILLKPQLKSNENESSDSLNNDNGLPCQFTQSHLDKWFDYLESSKVAITKDTWQESLTDTNPPQSIETAHQDTIHDAQLDYYGKRLATCSSDRTIKITDVSDSSLSSNYTNSNSIILHGHEGPVWQVAWAHPKFGSVLASCSYDGKVFIWKQDGQNWTRIKDHTLHTSSVNSISWSSHELGPILACASSDGNVSVLTFHNDGTWEASMLAAHKLGVTSVSWAPATTTSNILSPTNDKSQPLSQRLVTGGCDSLIKLWSFNNDSKQWQCDDTISTHSDWVRDVAWSPNVGLSKQYIASASQDKSVYIHTQDQPNGKWNSVKLAYDFKDVVWRVSWSLSGNVLAVSCGDGKVTLWKENMSGTFECVSDAA